MSQRHVNAAKTVFQEHGGRLRTPEALALGIHPRTLYQMRDEGEIVQISRGVFRLASAARLGRPDLVTVALRVPKAIVCLLSALAYHELTTEIPRQVDIALPRGTKTPRIEHPPIRVHRFTGAALTQGVEVVTLDGVEVKIYGPEKTVVDCFRFRNKLGIDVAVQALRLCLDRKGSKVSDILEYARACRAENVIRPYLEARL